ncbi:unnamed protein product [Leptidea sinapis]|uniref:Uncharacterized protein n=1 Tax=Leptidea sinapis TaxID=189913 RepID=A0A5E4R8R7_9NEOP|nr:unnamed protein product [Leptidea sinapis]
MALCINGTSAGETQRSVVGRRRQKPATMPINAETVNLAATYMILVILLFFLWLLYSAVF